MCHDPAWHFRQLHLTADRYVCACFGRSENLPTGHSADFLNRMCDWIAQFFAYSVMAFTPLPRCDSDLPNRIDARHSA
ncbi:Uncharacterised protein [Vibrio cholerae]|nr:Uncharacterised protein [Vibrio cholerae]